MENSYAFTMGSGGGGSLHGVRFWVRTTSTAEDAKPNMPAVTIWAQGYEERRNGQVVRSDGRSVWHDAREKTVRVGDVFRFNDVSHRVCNIVLPDAKQHVIGWIEFDQTPVQSDEDPGAPLLQPARRISIVGRNIPCDVESGFVGWTDNVVEKNGKQFARGVFVMAKDVSMLPNFPKASADLYRIDYPDVQEDDIVPLLGALYRVQGMSGGEEADMGLLRLPDQNAPPVPEGAKVMEKSYAFTIGGGGSLHGVPFRVLTAPKAEDATSDTPAVTIKAQTYDERRNGQVVWKNGHSVPHDGWEKTIRVGDLVRFQETTHRVCNIVLPDAERHIIGWIEFDQAPVQDADSDVPER